MCMSSTPPPNKKSFPENALPNASGTLGERIAQLGVICREKDVTLQELSEHLEGRSLLLLIFLFALPFCQPIPMLGLSTPLGLLLAFLGWRMMWGKELCIPHRFRSVKIPHKFFPALLSGAGRLLKWIERHLRQQWTGLVAHPWTYRICGANLLFCALLLALPLPIPFSNFFPALPIVLSMAALIESDGKMLFRAMLMAGINIIFWLIWLLLISLYGWGILDSTWTWLATD